VTEGHESKESENCSPRASNVTDYLWLSTSLCCVYDSDWIGILAYCAVHTISFLPQMWKTFNITGWAIWPKSCITI